jgi:hypothetical protein
MTPQRQEVINVTSAALAAVLWLIFLRWLGAPDWAAAGLAYPVYFLYRIRSRLAGEP